MQHKASQYQNTFAIENKKRLFYVKEERGLNAYIAQRTLYCC